MRRTITIDPWGCFPDWMHVVIEHPTGITYHQQYGGTACRHAGIEGFLVPVHAPDSLAELRRVFEEDLRGA